MNPVGLSAMSTILQEIGIISKVCYKFTLVSYTVDLSTAKCLNDADNRTGKFIKLL